MSSWNACGWLLCNCESVKVETKARVKPNEDWTVEVFFELYAIVQIWQGSELSDRFQAKVYLLNKLFANDSDNQCEADEI